MSTILGGHRARQIVPLYAPRLPNPLGEDSESRLRVFDSCRGGIDKLQTELLRKVFLPSLGETLILMLNGVYKN